MSNGKALLFALVLTAISVVALTLAHGHPTKGQFASGCITMFVAAFRGHENVGRRRQTAYKLRWCSLNQ
jgi:hypothetical protein